MVSEALSTRVTPRSSYVETSERDWLLGLAKSEDGKSFVAELRRKNGALAEVASRQLLVAEARLVRIGDPPPLWVRIKEKLLAHKIFVASGCLAVFVLWVLAFAGAITAIGLCCCGGGRSSFSNQATGCWFTSLFISCKPAPNKPFKVCF